MTDEWWRGAVGYEIYVRSFADGTGDGMGDLAGIRRHLDHLEWLGVDAVWLTPFFPSPGFDGGYDVADHTSVDPVHGDLATFDALVDDAHGRGIRVIVDLVPNHTSHLHPWFVESSSSIDSPMRDWYLWRDPSPDGGPPNNWVSHFGGPAWTFDGRSGQYYCHLFLPEQPDLNWENDQVRRAFDDIFAFWLERGVDGFRVDVAHSLLKHPSFADNPVLRVPEADADVWEVFDSFEHRFDLDQDGNVEIHRRWRALVEPYGAVLLGEIGVADPHRVTRYTRVDEGLHGVFFLELARIGWEPERLISTVRRIHELDPHGIAWVVDSHDTSRSASRFGGGERGAARSLALTTLVFGLGGMPFLFQGQELGLEDGRVDPDRLVDPVATRNAGSVGRDGARTGMPWMPGANDGFTTGRPWLPAASRSPEETVSVQRAAVDSWAHRHRSLIAARRSLDSGDAKETRWLDTGSARRAAAVGPSGAVVANFDSEPTVLHLPDVEWELLFASTDGASIDGPAATVPAESSAILGRVR